MPGPRQVNLGTSSSRLAPHPSSPAGSDIAAAISAVIGSVAELASGTEAYFVDLASDLKQLHAFITELTKATGERIHALREQLEGTRLIGLGGIVETAMEQLRSGESDAAALLHFLAGVSSALTELERSADEMSRISGYLLIARCVFAAESSKNAECVREFAGFIVELRDLSVTIAGMGKTIAGHAEKTQANLASVRQLITSSLAALNLLAKQSEINAQGASYEIQKLLDRSGDALRSAESAVRLIVGHVDQCVYYLQFGDIIRQKLEHVLSGFQDAVDIVVRLPESGSDQRQTGYLAAQADHLIAVQVAQLELMRKEVNAAEDCLKSAFNGIAREAANLVAAIATMHREDRRGGPDRNPFAGMRSELGKLEALHSQGVELVSGARAQTAKSMVEFSELLDHLGDVQKVNRQMHLHGLNAIIQATVLGEKGRTLGLLSQQIHRLFAESAGVVTETGRALAEIAAQRESLHEPTDPALEGLSDLQRCQLAISRIDDEFKSAVTSSQGMMAGEEERLGETRGKLKTLLRFSDRIATLIQQAKSVRPALKSLKGNDADQPGFVPVADRYTIESERDVHRSVVGLPNPLEQPDLRPDLGPDDNVEFF